MRTISLFPFNLCWRSARVSNDLAHFLYWCNIAEGTNFDIVASCIYGCISLQDAHSFDWLNCMMHPAKNHLQTVEKITGTKAFCCGRHDLINFLFLYSFWLKKMLWHLRTMHNILCITLVCTYFSSTGVDLSASFLFSGLRLCQENLFTLVYILSTTFAWLMCSCPS